MRGFFSGLYQLCMRFNLKSIKNKHIPQSKLCEIFFDKKVIEFINITSILYDPYVRSGIPSNINNIHVPTVVHNLHKPIHSRYFNFNKRLDVDRFRQNINSIKKENTSNLKGLFLDSDIDVKHWEIKSGVYYNFF